MTNVQNLLESGKISSSDIAGLLDHAILQPTLSDEQMKADLAKVRRYPIASVCIKPSAIRLAVEAMKGTQIGVGTVIGFPHGTPLPEVKAFEAEQAFRDGATEMDMVVNVGKVLSEDWASVREDIGAVLEVTRRHKGMIKVIFETDFLPQDKHKIRLCEICSELRVDYVKTSTGFGYVKGADGKYSYTGATEHDLKLMRQHCAAAVGVKASGGMRTLDDALMCIRVGCGRIGTTSTEAIVEAAKKRFGK